MGKIVTSLLSLGALIGMLYGVVQYFDTEYVGIDAYAADKDKSDIKALDQDLNFYQLQKSILYGQKREAAPQEQQEIQDDIDNLNTLIQSTKEQKRELLK